MEKKPLNQEQALQAWTQVQQLIQAGAYEEREVFHYETNTWPPDGVEETAFSLEEWAAKQALEFVWSWDTHTWSLQPIEMDVTPEDK